MKNIFSQANGSADALKTAGASIAQWSHSVLGLTHYQRLEERVLAQILGGFGGKRVLDVGCGQGKYLKILAAAGCLATGVDLNPEQVAALREQGLTAFTPEDLPEGERYDCILIH